MGSGMRSLQPDVLEVICPLKFLRPLDCFSWCLKLYSETLSTTADEGALSTPT